MTNGKADNHEGIGAPDNYTDKYSKAADGGSYGRSTDLYRPVENPDKTRPLWGENQWPAVPTFRAKYEEWINKMKALGLIVMEA